MSPIVKQKYPIKLRGTAMEELKNVRSGFLNERVTKKNIINKDVYQKYQL